MVHWTQRWWQFSLDVIMSGTVIKYIAHFRISEFLPSVFARSSFPLGCGGSDPEDIILASQRLLKFHLEIYLWIHAVKESCLWFWNRSLTSSNGIFLQSFLFLPVLCFSEGNLTASYCLDKAVWSRVMGRKAGGIYINPKKFGSLSKPCMKEMISFLNCVALNRNDDDKCVRQKDLLNACMDAQVQFVHMPFLVPPSSLCLSFMRFHHYSSLFLSSSCNFNCWSEVLTWCSRAATEQHGAASIIICRGLAGEESRALGLSRGVTDGVLQLVSFHFEEGREASVESIPRAWKFRRACFKYQDLAVTSAIHIFSFSTRNLSNRKFAR